MSVVGLVVLGFAAGLQEGLAVPADLLARVERAESARIARFETMARSVVSIYPGVDSVAQGGGSGVIIHPDGYGLTNYHVVGEFMVTREGVGGLSDGQLYRLRVLGVDPGGDVAFFQLFGRESFDAAPLGDSDKLRVGQPVVAMGNPFNLAEDFTPTVTQGIISGLHRYQVGQGNLLEYADCIQVSTSINPGNSGGPLFDFAGRVIGINGRASFEERGRVNVGVGYAISINQIKRFIPGLRSGKLMEHGTLGATVRQTGDAVIFDAVQSLSPAERAGIEPGDELLELMGRPIRTPNDFNNIIATLPADWTVRLRVRREQAERELTAPLERLATRSGILWAPSPRENAAQAGALLRVAAKVLPGGLGADGQRTLRLALRGAGADSEGDYRFSAEMPPAAVGPRPNSALLQMAARVLAPLAIAPAPEALELVGGEEYFEQVVYVVQHTPDPEHRVRLLISVDHEELLAAELWTGDALAVHLRCSGRAGTEGWQVFTERPATGTAPSGELLISPSAGAQQP